MGKCLYPRKGSVHTAPSNLPKIGTALNDMTWAQVRAISDAGLAADYFAVGDCKAVKVNGKVGILSVNATYYAFILGINHNPDKEGTNKIHFGCFKSALSGGKDLALFDGDEGSAAYEYGYFIMNIDQTNSGGWAACQMRKKVLGSDSSPASPTPNTLLAALPAELRAVMKPITKYTDNVGGGTSTAGNVTATTDYLPLLTPVEIGATMTGANSADKNYQVEYEYYSAGNSKSRYRHNNNTTGVGWWLRTPGTSGIQYFMIWSNQGWIATSGAWYRYGVAPCFAV